MTTHSENRPTPPARTRISATGDLIAAVPAMIGFTPHRSLVLMCLDGPDLERLTLGTTMRHDLVFPEPGIPTRRRRTGVAPEMVDVVDRFGTICARDNVRAAIALIVDDRCEIPIDVPARHTRYRVIAQHLADALSARGTLLLQSLLTDRIEDGCGWTALTGPSDSGLISDPRASAVTLAHVLEGRAVHESRDAVRDLLQPVDTEVSREVPGALKTVYAAETVSDRVLLDRLVRYIGAWAVESADRPAAIDMAAHHIAELGEALTRVMVRDSLLALALTDVFDTAEKLWTYLTRMLPTPERACPATLLAFSAYARGEGAMAAIALEVALDADPNYSLALLLDSSLAAGARPEMIREVASSGYKIAELCGVQLPPPSVE